MIQPPLWQISVVTTAEAEEAVADLLERTFSQPPSAYRSEKTGEVSVTVFLDGLPKPARELRSDLAQALQNMRGLGLDLGNARISIRPLKRENWAESWKRHFKPIEIGQKLLIKPGWSRRRAKPGQRVIVLDPGLSFGTGHHPTTLFCLRQITRFRRPGTKQSFLDIGSGSGILSIAASKLGYEAVTALDHDPEAVRAARENLKRNKAKVRLHLADLIAMPMLPDQRFDLVCANLIADLLVSQAEKIRNLLKPGGRLVTAGILRREFPEIHKKLHRFNLTLRASGVDKEWKSGVFAL